MKFEWISSPPAESALRALEGLYAAGMIDEDGRLTVIGEKVAECPIEVNIARMVRLCPCSVEYMTHLALQLFSSKDHKCGEEILTIAAMTTVQVRKLRRTNGSSFICLVIQDVFVIPEGAPGALAELERRKFTAEEGVSVTHSSISKRLTLPYRTI